MAGPVTRFPAKIYLASMIVQGEIVAGHARLSDYLNDVADDGVIQVDSARTQRVQSNLPPIVANTLLVYRRKIIFVDDLSAVPAPPAENLDYVRTDRITLAVGLEAGSRWLEGEIHLPPGAQLSRFAEGKSAFIPLTRAKIVGEPAAERTLLINRAKVCCLAPQSAMATSLLAPARAAQS